MLPIVDVNVDRAFIVLLVVAISLVFAGVIVGVDVVVFNITVELVTPLKWKITRPNDQLLRKKFTPCL